MNGSERVVVFSPHPDDDVIACGGTIAQRVRQGCDVHVVYMTDGRNSHRTVLGIVKDPSPEEVRLVRRAEAIDATTVLGVARENLTFLDFEDGSLRRSVDQARARVAPLLARLQAREIFFPSRDDRHSDHSATGDVVRHAIQDAGCDARLFEYIVWMVAEDRPKPSVTVVNDISNVLELKRRALGAHRSQVDLLWPSQQRPILDRGFLARFLTASEDFVPVTGTSELR